MKPTIVSLLAASLFTAAGAKATPPAIVHGVTLKIGNTTYAIKSVEVHVGGAPVGDPTSAAGAKFGSGRMRVTFQADAPVCKVLGDWWKEILNATKDTKDVVASTAAPAGKPDVYAISKGWVVKYSIPSVNTKNDGTGFAELAFEKGIHTKAAPLALQPIKPMLQGAAKQ